MQCWEEKFQKNDIATLKNPAFLLVKPQKLTNPDAAIRCAWHVSYLQTAMI
jgi:hypothetical protein